MRTNLKRRRILVTRNEPKATAFAEKIEQRNGIALVAPLIEIVSTVKQEQVAIIRNIQRYEWIVFTSANGVDFFMERLLSEVGNTQLKNCRIAAVGSKTNQALQNWKLEADFIPSIYNADTMAEEFLIHMEPQGPILLVQGERSRTILNDAFKKQLIPTDSIQIYTTITHQAAQGKLQELLLSEKIDYITFASPSTVDAFINLTEDSSLYKSRKVVCIGTTTEERAQTVGFSNTITPKTFTIEGMLAAIHEDILTKE